MRSSETDIFFRKTVVEKNFSHTAKNTVILPNFLVWKFCGEAQFPHNFVPFAQNYAETASFHKISTSGN